MLIKGSDLNYSQRALVLAAFVHRTTHENARQSFGGRCPLCVLSPHPYKPGRNYTEAGRKGAAMSQEEWHAYHVPLTSDEEWLSKHAFHFTSDGKRLMRNKHYAVDASEADYERGRGGKRRHGGVPECDKCGKPNLIHGWSNYCQPCRDAYQARVARDPETAPIGSRLSAERYRQHSGKRRHAPKQPSVGKQVAALNALLRK